jgi:hypothetical protein
MADTVSGGAYRPLPDYLRATLERVLRAGGRDLGVLDAAMRRAAAMDPFPEAESALSTLLGAGLTWGCSPTALPRPPTPPWRPLGCVSASRW